MNVTATLFGQILTLAVLVWFINRYLWVPLTQAMQARTAKIADGLAAAERGKHELELAEHGAADRLRKAKQDAAEVIAKANKQATEIIEDAKEQARAEGQRQLEAAKAEIDQEKSRAKEQLREEVISLALLTAEKVLAREINAAAHNDLIATLVKQL
jgi:F-type H+-transporting ATPase subunit b